MDHLNPEIARLFAAKQRRRARLAAQPFPEKVRAVVQMQRMAAPVLRARGKRSGCGSWNPSTSDLGHSPPWLTKEIGHWCFRAAQPRLPAVVNERPAAAPPNPHSREWGIPIRLRLSDLARLSVSHISTTRPHCRVTPTSTPSIAQRDGSWLEHRSPRCCRMGTSFRQ